jgi:lysozyme
MPINVVVDISHHNGNVDLGRAQAAGIVGVIHKATQGTSMFDNMYQQNRQKAQAAGLLWGAYHFATAGDGAAQADFFLSKAAADEQTLIVLDYEPNQNSTMTLDQAKAFVTRVHEVTGRFPGFYSGSLIKEKLGGKPPDPVLSQCFLWLAQYGPAPKNIPATWPDWTMWQYTDGNIGPPPHSVDGIGNCDRDQFNGTIEALRELWGVGEAAAGGGLVGEAGSGTIVPGPSHDG